MAKMARAALSKIKITATCGDAVSRSASGHSLPSPPIMPSTRCRLRTVSDGNCMAAQYVAIGQKQSLPTPDRPQLW
jgi:hypothetical protein